MVKKTEEQIEAVELEDIDALLEEIDGALRVKGRLESAKYGLKLDETENHYSWVNRANKERYQALRRIGFEPVTRDDGTSVIVTRRDEENVFMKISNTRYRLIEQRKRLLREEHYAGIDPDIRKKITGLDDAETDVLIKQRTQKNKF